MVFTSDTMAASSSAEIAELVHDADTAGADVALGAGATLDLLETGRTDAS